MGRQKQAKTLSVYLNNIAVGELTKESTGLIRFSYNKAWLKEGFAISHSLPLQEVSYQGEIVSRYFDNLLPDNDEIKKTVATKFGAQSIRMFDLLEVIGRECVGALSFVPEGFIPKEDLNLNYKTITKNDIAKRLKNLSSTHPLGMHEKDFRISIAGAQEKAAFLFYKNLWHEPLGLTPTTHIFKTSIGAMGMDVNFSDSVDNEWFCLQILKKLNLKVCHAQIQNFLDQRVLVIERFDRVWKTIDGELTLLRLPQEDMCQALGVSPYQKYQNEGGPGILEIMQFLRASKNQNDRFDFFKAILIFDLLYATDGHAKNFSVAIRSDGFNLTPFYDVMGGYFLHKREKIPLENLKLAMKVGNSGHYAFKRVKQKHYQEQARACGLTAKQYEKIYYELKQEIDNLHFSKDELPLDFKEQTADLILEGIKKRSKEFFTLK